MSDLATYFDQFVRERTYLNNVTPKTRDWYQTAWRAFQRWQRSAPQRATNAPLICRADLQQFVVHLRERGVRPISCNCWVRAPNAFCRCLHEQGHTAGLVRLPPQKVEKRLLAIHDERTLRLILGYRPRTFIQWRVHAVACTILDAGCRIDELLSALVSDFDFDNLLLTVMGKGRKQRKVPISMRCERSCIALRR
jgi:integrase/recombinase XerD